MKVFIEDEAARETTAIKFVAGNAALTAASFGDDDELIVTLPANEADYTTLQTAIDAATEVTDAVSAATSVTGVRDDPESALANLLTALATAGIITDDTDATTP